MSAGRRGPAWVRLVRHSHRLGAHWVSRGLGGGGWRDPRGGLYRLLVPVEPWRYHELARLAREPFAGDCLDISSPKLLPSLLAHEGQGRWIAIDVLEDEIARWRALDPGLDLRVQDARALDLPDRSVDAIACVSVIEHVAGDGDGVAMAEMWRVLRPGGVVHLTTNIARRAGEVRTALPVYGPAERDATTPPPSESAFFERRYDDTTLAGRLLALPWEVEAREYVRERVPLHRWFFAGRPWSFAAGNLLPLACVGNFRRIGGAAEVPDGRHGVVYLRLRRPA